MRTTPVTHVLGDQRRDALERECRAVAADEVGVEIDGHGRVGVAKRESVLRDAVEDRRIAGRDGRESDDDGGLKTAGGRPGAFAGVPGVSGPQTLVETEE